MPEGREQELIARCRHGDQAAWDDLFQQHYEPAARFVFQISPDFSPEDVEEICQDTFLAVVKHLGTFVGNSRLQTWIFRIAANKARDYRERQHAAKRGGGKTPLSLQAEDPETGLALDPPSPAAGPDTGLMRQEQAALVGVALGQLGGPCQEIIQLRYFGDLSYEEIAAALELNPKTVSSRLSKCLDQLEKTLKTVFAGKKTTPFSV